MLTKIGAADEPVSVRHLFYRLVTTRGYPKQEAFYKLVSRTATAMREGGELPFDWIVDGLRTRIRPTTYSRLADAVEAAAAGYRRALWDDAETHVVVVCEKDAVSGIIVDETWERDVDLRVMRGFASCTAKHELAEAINAAHADGRETVILYVGDHDPSGVAMQEEMARKLRHPLYCGEGPEITWRRIAVTPEQIREHNYPTRPAKPTDTRTATWTGGGCVEVDVIDSATLKRLVGDAIDEYMPGAAWAEAQKAEALERETLRALKWTV